MGIIISYGVMILLGLMNLVVVVVIAKEIIEMVINYIRFLSTEDFSGKEIGTALIKFVILVVGVAAMVVYIIITHNILVAMSKTIYLMGG